MDELVAKGLSLRTVDVPSRSVSFIASTDAIDSYDEIVEQDNWRLERFKANPVILFGHNSRDLPVGKATRVEVVESNGRKQLECTVQFLTAAANPLAEQVWQSVQEGGLRAVSVGFMPGSTDFVKRDGREVYMLRSPELHEISVVPIPANPEAVAKMKAKARAEATDTRARTGLTITETVMTITEKEMTERVAKADAEKSLAEKQLADVNKDLASAKSALGLAEGTIKSLEADRDAHKARADKAEKSVVDAEVEQLVGVKITPAEKADFVQLAQSNRPMFERMVAARPEMKLLSGAVVGADKSETPAVIDNGSSTNGGSLASKIFGS